MKNLALSICAAIAFSAFPLSGGQVAPADLDRLLAPIALYPDSLLAQMLMCAQDPAGVKSLDNFLKGHAKLKGTELQDAALKDNFEPSFVAMALFPQVIAKMAADLDGTTQLGHMFMNDRANVFASIQRLRKQASDAGTLKTTAQQEVETQTTSSGEQVIVIEPANPQIIYVPQYNTQTVYVAAPPTTVVVQNTSSADAAVAGVIGFTAGIAIGAAVNNSYYYGPYGMHGGAYMYNDAWDDYADHREDAREDWQDHREDMSEERGDRAGNAQEQRTDRQENRTDARGDTQRTSSSSQKASGSERASTASTSAARGSGSYESRGQTDSSRTKQQPAAQQQRSGTKSDAFSGYSSGKSERAASSRGSSSRSSSRSRSGGGGRRR